jgi:predicted dehydrogenase
MTQEVRIGLVGAGRIAASHAAALQKVPGVTFAAVVEPNDEAREAVTSEFGVPGFKSHEDSGFADACDAAIVSAPPVFHTQIAIDLMSNGLDLLVEKPFAINPDAARQMLAVANQLDRVIAVASKYRYSPDVRAAKRMIDEGLIGRVDTANVTFSSVFDPTARWHAIRSISGGGVISDNAPHAADLIRYVLGPIEEVAASEGPRRPGLEVEDEATLLFVTETAEVMTYLSWRRQMTAPYLEVIGDRGSIRLDWGSSMVRANGEDRQFGNGFDRVAAFQGNLLGFLASVHRHDTPAGAKTDAMAAVLVVDGLYRSLASGEVERVAAPMKVSA